MLILARIRSSATTQILSLDLFTVLLSPIRQLRRGLSTITVPTRHSLSAVSTALYPPFQWPRLFNSSSNVTLPGGSWDSHVHIIDPDKYPLPTHIKRPQKATIGQALTNAKQLRLPNMVLVQLSSYSNDNA